MARVRNYNEDDAFILTYKFLDDGLASTPTTVRYRIDCLTTRRAVRDWTDVDPDDEVEITVTSDDNAILNQRNTEERKQIVVQSNAGTSTQKSTTDEWVIKNLQGLT